MNLVLLFENDFFPDSTTAKLTGRRFKHVKNVHKAEPGVSLKVGLVNGKTGEGLIVSMDRDSLLMDVTVNNDPPPPLPLNLVIALPRPKVLNRVIGAAASMGVKNIWLINAYKVEKSYWQSPRLSPENIIEQSILGLEQAKDTVLPTINLKNRFKPFVEDDLPQIIIGTIPIVADPSGIEPCPCEIKTPVTLTIGPEGGFIPYEIELLKRCNFIPVHLGKRILRVETAIPAVIYRVFSPLLL